MRLGPETAAQLQKLLDAGRKPSVLIVMPSCPHTTSSSQLKVAESVLWSVTEVLGGTPPVAAVYGASLEKNPIVCSEFRQRGFTYVFTTNMMERITLDGGRTKNIDSENVICVNNNVEDTVLAAAAVLMRQELFI